MTSIEGAGTSPLDVLQDQPIDFDVVWQHAGLVTDDGDEQGGCYGSSFGGDLAVSTAYGASAELVQSEILDRLDEWKIALHLCEPGIDQPRSSFHAANADIFAAFNCAGIPDSAQVYASEGRPAMTTFTATECEAKIEYLANGRTLKNASVSIRIETGPAQLP